MELFSIRFGKVFKIYLLEIVIIESEFKNGKMHGQCYDEGDQIQGMLREKQNF